LFLFPLVLDFLLFVLFSNGTINSFESQLLELDN